MPISFPKDLVTIESLEKQKPKIPMIHGLLSLFFFVWIFATTLEVISGSKIIPRLWWLRNQDAAPACIVCSSTQSFTIPKAYEAWERFEKERWKHCVETLQYRTPTKDQRAPCDAPYIADWYSLGSQLHGGGRDYYSTAMLRLKFAVWARDGSLLWNQILGFIFHITSLLFLGFFAMGVEDFREHLKQRKKLTLPFDKVKSQKS